MAGSFGISYKNCLDSLLYQGSFFGVGNIAAFIPSQTHLLISTRALSFFRIPQGLINFKALKQK
jgi:hypothetical protein